MKEWQFNVLFFVGIGGAITLLFGPSIGLNFDQNPTAISGVGAILAYVLTQKNKLTKDDDPESKSKSSHNKRTIVVVDEDEDLDKLYGRVMRERLERRLEEGDDNK